MVIPPHIGNRIILSSRTLFLGIYSKEFNRTLNTHTCATFFTAVLSTLTRQTPRSKVLYTHTRRHTLWHAAVWGHLKNMMVERDGHRKTNTGWFPFHGVHTVVEFRDRKWSELLGNHPALEKGSRQWLPDNVKALKDSTEPYFCFSFFSKSQKVNQIGRSTPVEC